MKDFFELREKSVSQAQQKMMGMALAYKRGEMDDASPEVKKMADSMSTKDLEDFAKTKHKGLPVQKESVELDEKMKDKPYEKQIFGMGDSRSEKEIRDQISGLSDATLKKWASKPAGRFGSKVAKLQDKLVAAEMKKRGLKEEVELGEGTDFAAHRAAKANAPTQSDREKMRKVARLLAKERKPKKEEVDLDEAFTPKEIKMAIGVASDKRYAKGNMTGAVNAIEKIKKGLSDHPQVRAVLQRQNESAELSEAKSGDELMDYAKSSGGIDKAELMKLAGKLQNHSETGNPSTMADIVKMIKGMDTDPRDAAMSIIKKNDPAMYRSIVIKAKLSIFKKG